MIVDFAINSQNDFTVGRLERLRTALDVHDCQTFVRNEVPLIDDFNATPVGSTMANPELCIV